MRSSVSEVARVASMRVPATDGGASEEEPRAGARGEAARRTGGGLLLAEGARGRHVVGIEERRLGVVPRALADVGLVEGLDEDVGDVGVRRQQPEQRIDGLAHDAAPGDRVPGAVELVAADALAVAARGRRVAGRRVLLGEAR